MGRNMVDVIWKCWRVFTLVYCFIVACMLSETMSGQEQEPLTDAENKEKDQDLLVPDNFDLNKQHEDVLFLLFLLFSPNSYFGSKYCETKGKFI